MDLKNLQTILDFNETLKEVTNFETETFRIENYKQDINTHRTGYYFKVTDLSERKNDIWIWLGAYFGTHDRQICIAVENGEGWGKPFYDIIDQGKYGNIDKTIIDKEDNTYFFYPKETPDFFNTIETYEQQKEYLKDFVIEVVNYYLN